MESPRGSVLGPLLFTLYVNDIPGLIESNVRMFADATKIYSVIQSFDDRLRLQSDVDRLLQWSHTWLLQFNIAKCKLIRIGNSAPLTWTVPPTYPLKSQKCKKKKILVFGTLKT